jgi:hypothetical protein
MNQSVQSSEEVGPAVHGSGETRKTEAKTPVGSPAVLVRIRDRIRELRRVRAGVLVPNPRNWRRHPRAQAEEALRGLLTEIGYADALLVRELPDGRLMIIDGHLRAETTPDALVPVLLLDVSEEEANKILLTLDPLAAMAERDAERIEALLQTVKPTVRRSKKFYVAPPGSRCGRAFTRRPASSLPHKSTRRLSCRGSGALKTVNSGSSTSIACCTATQPIVRTLSG